MRRSTGHALAVGLAGGCLAFAAAGCGSPAEPDVTRAAADFYAAVAAGDGAAACSVLSARAVSELERSAGRPCAEAILEEQVPDVAEPVETRVFGTMAQVRYSGETAFLSRFDEGWRVTGAACTPAADGRYDCRVSGG